MKNNFIFLLHSSIGKRLLRSICQLPRRSIFGLDQGSRGGSTDHFSALKIWMFENKFVSLPSHLKTIEPMEVHRGAGTMCNTEISKVISRTDFYLCMLESEQV